MLDRLIAPEPDCLFSILWPRQRELCHELCSAAASGMSKCRERGEGEKCNCYVSITAMAKKQQEVATRCQAGPGQARPGEVHLNNSLVCSSNQCCISIAKLQNAKLPNGQHIRPQSIPDGQYPSVPPLSLSLSLLSKFDEFFANIKINVLPW